MADNNIDDDEFQQNIGESNPLEDMKQDEKLPEDNDTPFSPPGGTQDRIDDTFPDTDTNVDDMERYDEGIEGASGVDMPGSAADENNEVPDTEE